MLADIEQLDASPVQDHDHPLNERVLVLAAFEDAKSYDPDAGHIEVEQDGHTYQVVYHSRRRDEVYFELWFFNENDESADCPIGSKGFNSFYRRKLESGTPDIEATVRDFITKETERFAPIRIIQQRGYMTEADIRAALAGWLTSGWHGEKWDKFKSQGGLNDDDFRTELKQMMGEQGQSARDRLHLSLNGSGFRVWASYWSVNTYSAPPDMKGETTVKMARDILAMPNPDINQMSLF